MKTLIPILFLILLTACHQKHAGSTAGQSVDSLKLISIGTFPPSYTAPDTIIEDSITATYRSMALKLADVTGYTEISIYKTNDSAGPDWHDNEPFTAVGKLIDRTHIFALTCRNFDNDTGNIASLKFYRWDGQKWLIEGQFIVPCHVVNIEFMRVGYSQSNSIRVQGAYNMNGNAWQYFFVYKRNVHSLGFAGKFFSSFYKIDEVHHSLKMEYFGSWYMDNLYVLYVWHNDSLVPVREAKKEMVVKSMDVDTSNNYRLTYSINPDTSYSKPLKVVYTERGNNSTLNHRKYWDHFWDIK